METRISRNIETFGLDENLHELAVTMVRNDAQSVGNYYLDKTNGKIDCEYSDLLAQANEKGAEIYTLSHFHLGHEHYDDILGYVAVYDEDRSTQNNDLEELEFKLIRLVNLFDDVNESLRHFASRLLMDTSEDNPMEIDLIVDTDEDQGLSDLEKLCVKKIYQDPSEGIIWVLFEGTDDYVEWDTLTYSTQFQIIQYLNG